MLLSHAWLAPLVKPATIGEEDEEAAEAAAEAGEDLPESTTDATSGATPIGDQQPPDQAVADWVQAALERKRSGKLGAAAKPALHAAPLDAVPSPGQAQASA